MHLINTSILNESLIKMSFDHLPVSQLIRILKAGLGFTLNRRTKCQSDIEQLDRVSKTSGAQITWIEPLSTKYAVSTIIKKPTKNWLFDCDL
jgi:hypothetical protein